MTDTPAPADEAAAMTKDQVNIEDTLLQSVSWMCDHYDMRRTPAALVAGLPWNGALSPSLALQALSNVGLTGGVVKRGLAQLPAQVMPMILLRKKQGGAVLLERREVRDEENKRQLRYTVIRFVRAHLLDVAAKKADLVLGAMLFRQALSVKMEHKPASSGAFANQLREFESVRDFATSATLAAISDLPFVLMFVGVIFAIGGPLGWIPLLILPLIVIISVSIQWPLARVMKENLRESSLKQGVLIESIEGMETLKSTGGSANMQRRWQHFSALQSATSMKSRRLSSIATGTVTLLQQLQTVVLVITGVYLITAGTLSMGALIGTVMLAGRATAPLGQVIGLAVRFQQAKAALGSLNKLMEMPQDRDPAQDYLPVPNLSGQLSLKKIGFSYPAPPMQPNPPVLTDISLSIAPGERVAILGRIGSGKSTLLRVMSRLYSPTEGQMFTDGLDVNQIDPADWRKAVGFVNQEARLFHGTLRENVMLGCPDASVDEFLRVLRLTGLDQFAAAHPRGVNLPIGENGDGVSGGQRQLISLARTLLARPRLLLMDEPTSAMDAQTEAQFLEHLHRATQGQTLVVVTHRPSLLNLVDRVIVMDNGRVFADGPKANVLAALGANAEKQNAEKPAAAQDRPQAAAATSATATAATSNAVTVAAQAPAPSIQAAPIRVRHTKTPQQEAH
ncbi:MULTISPECIES: ATP-binding cassette domain-containing protein [Stenotrophomonas]|uniref:ATP-binding cassette domain-containing protein n=1 Tax=Stenotrophomonas TaxID=40323 RepID=UPI0009EB77FC|nr:MULTISPECIES: ATP-binding cassette domain-containing protein [Stenotrophomonas]